MTLQDAADLMDRMWGYGGWEVEQTHESLRPYLIEETYELLDALGSGNDEAITEELGDLLLMVLFHSRIAQAQGRFTVDDVAAALIGKLTHRSPHLTNGHTGPLDAGVQDENWHARKAAEKAHRSSLDDIPLDQPSLVLAEKVLRRVDRAGFPADLVPEALRSVPLSPDGTAEVRLRATTLAFMAAVRAAENAAAAAAGVRAALDANAWRTFYRPPDSTGLT
jgi:XTP/dITP diphosphohydrolase